MKMRILFALMAVCVAGCTNTAVVYRSGHHDVPSNPASGHYMLGIVSVRAEGAGSLFDQGMNSQDLRRLLLGSDAQSNVFRPTESRSVQIGVDVVRRVTDNNGILAGLNNLVSYLTLMTWPRYSSEMWEYEIMLLSKEGTKSQRKCSFEKRSFTSLLPLGYIPVPAWADVRNAHGVILSGEKIEPILLRSEVMHALSDLDYEKLRESD